MLDFERPLSPVSENLDQCFSNLGTLKHIDINSQNSPAKFQVARFEKHYVNRLSSFSAEGTLEQVTKWACFENRSTTV